MMKPASRIRASVRGDHYSGRRLVVLAMMFTLTACNEMPHVDLAPTYEPVDLIVPEKWRGASPFAVARPADAEIRFEWWKLFQDPVLNRLEEQAMAANPEIQASAERFIQARDMMMKAKSRLFPQIGLGLGASDNKQSENALFRSEFNPVYDTDVVSGSIATWEPDFWSLIRNRTRVQTRRAQERAADYWLARLSIQAELAQNYYILRGFDAQNSVYKKSIAYYKQSLDIVTDQFNGKIASELDVARVKYLLHSTEAKAQEIEGDREVVEHAIATLLNVSPSTFKVAPVGDLHIPRLAIPKKIPSTLLERRPDIAAMEREMAQANAAIGIARAAFFPNVTFNLGGGFENKAFNLFQLANSYWAYGSMVSLPIFEGGMRRAALQQSWAAYRETEDKYRGTVLKAFREVEDGLSLTNRLSAATKRQELAVAAAEQTQNLTMELFRGGLISSLDLVYAEINTLTARIESVKIKARLLESAVALVRSLGGGWQRGRLPTEDEIQPFEVLDYQHIDTPVPAGGIQSPEDPERYRNLRNDAGEK
jgi:multidrug efflux system outer membrane protein